MSMLDWAKKEIEIACKKENPNRKNGEWDYGCACYESALKAFESLLEDGHSGFSIGITKNILNRLIDGKPLTPIEDIDDVWRESYKCNENYKTYQCNRMSSLFKDVYNDGTIKYNDVNRIVCYDINDERKIYFHNGFINRVVSEMFPITMPYLPESKSYKVACEEFLTDRINGDYDTMGILYVMTPKGKKVEINRYFKEAKEGFEEIDEKEYIFRKELDEKRRSIESEATIKVLEGE